MTLPYAGFDQIVIYIYFYIGICVYSQYFDWRIYCYINSQHMQVRTLDVFSSHSHMCTQELF